MLASALAIRAGAYADSVLNNESPPELFRYAIKYDAKYTFKVSNDINLIIAAIKIHCRGLISPKELTSKQYYTIIDLNKLFFDNAPDEIIARPGMIKFLIEHGIYMYSKMHKYMTIADYDELLRHIVALPNPNYIPRECFNSKNLFVILDKISAVKYMQNFDRNLLLQYWRAIINKNPLAFCYLLNEGIENIIINVSQLIEDIEDWCDISYYRQIIFVYMPEDIKDTYCRTTVNRGRPNKSAPIYIESAKLRYGRKVNWADNTIHIVVVPECDAADNHHAYSYNDMEYVINIYQNAISLLHPEFISEFTKWYSTRVIHKLALLSALTNPMRAKVPLVYDVAEIIADMYLNMIL
jgi:hypothetical protein